MSRPARLPRWAGNRLSVSAGLRGKVALRALMLRRSRITPACAGKRLTFPPLMVAKRDHPRVCGEKMVDAMEDFQVSGSPPRVRGKAQPSLLVALEGRITPACAGKRSPRRPGPQRSWDHPRVCGEKTDGTSEKRDCAGSPPRVRGKAPGRCPPAVRCRITPACAGKR